MSKRSSSLTGCCLAVNLSTFFRDLLSAPLTTGNNIPLDITSANLKLLLDIMHSVDASTKPTFEQYNVLLMIARRYDLPSVTNSLILRLHNYLEQHPWDSFVLAAQHHSPAVAKVALANVAEDKHHCYPRLETLPQAAIKDIPSVYAFCLAKGMAAARDEKYAHTYWRSVSQNFELPF